MNLIDTLLGTPLGYLMYICYILVNDYGIAIILFTLLSKIILFPISLKVQKNSIKMVKLKPELDEIKERYAGDKEKIAEEQLNVYEREKYSPALGCLPMLLQIPLVLGLISVIYNPLTHLLHIDKASITALAAKTEEVLGISELGAAAQIRIIEAVNSPMYKAQFSEIAGVSAETNSKIRGLGMNFFGIHLSETPSVTNISVLLLIPLLAGLSAFALCIFQNKANVLQREQSKVGQWGMTVFTVAFSIYFAFIVPAGVGLYWIFSNIFAILQLMLLNKIYDPYKYIDYSKLQAKPVLSKEELAERKARKKANRAREKEDYKRFFSYHEREKQLVFYSEKSGFYKYFENIIDYILNNSEIVIHYVTSDPDDVIFQRNNPRIIPYYIGDRALMSFMMKMDADMVVMTMPDLQQFHIKRSLVRKDIEYVYVFHYPLSTHMVLRKGALDYYDTIFCVGEFQFEEIRETEKLYGLPEKRLIACGYGQLEKLYNSYCRMQKVENLRKKLLIAPSWQPGNILDSCVDKLLSALLGKGFQVVVRPHPEYVKRFGSRMDAIVQRYKDYNGGDLTFELDFSSNDSIFNSDVVITDWSGTAYEFSFVTKKPSVFINTPPKINNPEYDKIEVKPLEITLRDKIGIQIEPERLENIAEEINKLLDSAEKYRETITSIVDKYIANFGRSGEVGGRYIIDRLQEIGAKKKYES
ncbi:MAG: membrane protein insertase YidC [Caulobacteraceae bacterium]